MLKSIRARLLISTNILLIVLFTVTACMLDKIYRTNMLESERNRLHTQLVELTSIAESSFGMNTSLSEDVNNNQLLYKNSGLYATLQSQDGRVVWQSPSMQDLDLNIPRQNSLRKDKFYRVVDDNKGPLFVLNMAFNWVGPEGYEAVYLFTIAKSQADYWKQVESFRESLLYWMLPLYVIAVLLHYVLLRWGFSPLTQVAEDLRKIEQGKSEKLEGRFPEEIQRLTTNINQLITHERKRQIQYQNALGDLAHSLKTPLAVLASSKQADEFEEQIAQIDNLISYQLKRATHGTQNTFAPCTPVKPLLDKLLMAMDKIYAHKEVSLKVNLKDERVSYQAQTEDLYELLGNLIENAYKYCDKHVHIELDYDTSQDKPAFKLRIENDGEQIPQPLIDSVLTRGVRASETKPGQGIGLAVVNTLVESFGGSLKISASSLGGALIDVALP